MLSSRPPSVEITPKTPAKLASLNVRRHPPSLKSPNAILELSDANFAGVLWVILMLQNQRFIYTPEFTGSGSVQINLKVSSAKMLLNGLTRRRHL